MTRKGKLLILPPLAVGIVIFVLLVRSNRGPVRERGSERAQPVRVVSIEPQSIVPTAVAYGTVEPGRTWQAVSEVSGRIESLVCSSLGDVANLVGFEIKQGDPLRVVLIWEATAVPLTHYSVFVHLLDESGAIVGQGDGPPVGGDYPTHLWEPGELIVDEHKMVIDPDAQQGSYHLAVGWYRLEDGIRLPVRDEEGTSQPEDRVILPAVVELP